MIDIPILENIQHQEFAEAYLRLFNEGKAAIAAGYAEKSARNQGYRLMKNDDIRAYIRARMEAAAMETNEVLYHLAQIARGDIDDMLDDDGNLDIKKARQSGKSNLIKRVKKKTIITADKDGEGSDIFETETEAYDRMKALELIGKHLAMFTDKVEQITWQTRAIADIQAGKVTYRELASMFDETLADVLFKQAGVPVER